MKVFFVANGDWYLYNFKFSLAQAVRRAGHEVVLVTPPGKYVSRFQQAGFRWISYPLDRHGMNPLREARSLFSLARLYHREAPDLVHHFTAKAIVHGSLAAKLTNVRLAINAVTGGASAIGDVLDKQSLQMRLLKQLLQKLMKVALRGSEVIFQNPDDQYDFEYKGLVEKAQSHLIRSSGVDIEKFIPKSKKTEPPMVVMAGRMLKNKGVGEFVEAARLLTRGGTKARFVLVGAPDSGNPMSVSEGQLQAWNDEGIVEWWGFREDMPAVLKASRIFCLPTWYPEGVPKSLLEAAACACPLVATDTAGCREIVRPEENGMLVPPRDAEALAEALHTILESPDRQKKMGARSREIVQEDFSVERVNEKTLALYEKLERQS